MAVVVDSAASLPADMIRPEQLHVVPMILNDTTYLDGRDLTPAVFYRMLRESPTLPSTSAPSPASFLDAYRLAAAEAQAVLCLTVASRFSASCDSARTAVREAKDALPGLEIRVLDTQSAAGGQGLIALEAWRAAKRGDGLEKVMAVSHMVMSRVRLIAYVDTLSYLRKGGRVSKIAHAGTSLLDIKPIFELVQGEVRTLARPRTRRRAMKGLLEHMRRGAESERVHATVMHADAAEAAEELRKQVEAEFSCEELYVSEFTPVMGAHIGPGLVGIAYWSG